jgi:hypothetical protein
MRLGRIGRAFEAATPMLSQLLKAEMAEREVRSISYHMKAARFAATSSRPATTATASRHAPRQRRRNARRRQY